MKKLLPLFLIVASLVFTISCNKEETPQETPNQAPTCKITAPNLGDEFDIGQTIIISVEADDSDGSIEEIRFYINGVGKGSVNSFPYNYSWNTQDENIGNYTVKATSYDNEGSSKSDEIDIKLIEGEPIGIAPIAAFSATPTSGTAPLTVNFTDESENNPTSWQWDFGDGGTSTQPDPSHTYISEGNYTVSLTVSNNDGSDTETITDYIQVNESGNAPIAAFSATPTSGTAPLTVNFTDESENNPTSWQWDFGDGGSSTQPSPTHTFNSDGNYIVSLTVSNDEGSDTKTGSIFVGDAGGGDPCPGTPTITYEGQTYNTVQIGAQCWLKENLNVGTRINGSQDMQDGNGIEKYCYNDDENNCNTYGGLYQWDEMMQYSTQEGIQGICPNGWHIPTDDEWKTMEMALGMSQSEADDIGYRGTDEGEKMKSTSGWNSNGNGTNISGFTALPGEFRYGDGSFNDLGNSGSWWSSSENSGTYAWYRGLYYGLDQVGRIDIDKTYGFSVRCLKN